MAAKWITWVGWYLVKIASVSVSLRRFPSLLDKNIHSSPSRFSVSRTFSIPENDFFSSSFYK